MTTENAGFYKVYGGSMYPRVRNSTDARYSHEKSVFHGATLAPLATGQLGFVELINVYKYLSSC